MVVLLGHLTHAAQESPQFSGPEYVWTYRKEDGLNPPEPGTVFLVLIDSKDASQRQLMVGSESLVTSRGKLTELNLQREVYYEGSAPPRDVAFHRFDLDGDGVDEVLVTGRGGAGGTCWFAAYRVAQQSVHKLFDGTSRFGFVVFDDDSDGKFEIGNAGFDWQLEEDNVLAESKWSIYRIVEGKYTNSASLAATAFREKIAGRDLYFRGPLGKSAAVLTVYGQRK